MLPNKCAISLDPFLQILVEEIEDLFVNGKEIYPIHVHAYSIWAGIEVEYAGQVGKLIQGGMRPCRRCNLVGKLRRYNMELT